jgi:hypothetical protein
MVYILAPSQSRVSVQGFATGMLGGLGHDPIFVVREFNGELDGTTDDVAKTVVHLNLRADSLAVTNAANASDRDTIESKTRLEVLESAAYPQIAYDGSVSDLNVIADGWYRVWLLGKLSLRGVVKPHKAEAQLRFTPEGISLTGRCPVLLSAFNIAPPRALGGLVKLKDELVVEFALSFVARDT